MQSPSGSRESRQHGLWLAELTTLAVASVFIILRIISRRLKKVNLWFDDYFALCTYAMSLGWLATTTLFISKGLGLHIEDANAKSANISVDISILLFVAELVYAFMLFFAKLSILCLYWRLFSLTNLRMPIQILTCCSIIWIVIRVFMGVFHCVPVYKFWEPSVEGRCDIADSKFFFGSVLTHVILDMIILALPVVQTRKLQLPKLQKFAISVVFMFGIFTCAAGLAIVIESTRFDGSDLTWNFAGLMVWACIEVNLVTLSTCMPTVWPALMCLVSAFKDRKDLWSSKHSIQLHSMAKAEENDASSSTYVLNISTQRIRRSHDSVFDSIGEESGTQTTVVGVCLEEGRQAHIPLQFGTSILVESETIVQESQDERR